MGVKSCSEGRHTSQWLVNTEGLPGNFVEGDLHQEHYNGELDKSCDHNDAEWDGNLMRNVCS